MIALLIKHQSTLALPISSTLDYKNTQDSHLYNISGIRTRALEIALIFKIHLGWKKIFTKKKSVVLCTKNFIISRSNVQNYFSLSLITWFEKQINWMKDFAGNCGKTCESTEDKNSQNLKFQWLPFNGRTRFQKSLLQIRDRQIKWALVYSF